MQLVANIAHACLSGPVITHGYVYIRGCSEEPAVGKGMQIAHGHEWLRNTLNQMNVTQKTRLNGSILPQL